MRRSFDSELHNLNSALIGMGQLCETAIEEALLGLEKRDCAHFDLVFLVEKSINDLQMSVDAAATHFLATKSPVARDLRLVVGILKANTDLERIGDQAVNIAHMATNYIKEPPLDPLVDFSEMAAQARLMVREALEAFLTQNEDLARQVLARDDRVDHLKNKIFAEVVANFMMKDPGTVRRGLDLILIARNLERVGDHATNIAEDAIYISSGQDVRHGQRQDKATG